MKIQGQGPVTFSRTGSSIRTGETSQRSSAVGDVKVSQSARALADLRAPETPDPERIAKLRGQIERGELEIDPEKIAETMLREER
ncbi:MAG: flagellar biosynthesis anti-sigma factor FlgM [Sandaracinaceae bacterium]|nr:flagellar biosynthesis anti-sigma factor FlgM [Sandaracinaceae bacterium]